MEAQERKRLVEKARDIRKLVIQAIGRAGSGHVGGAMSITDTLVILYYKFMNVDPKNPGKKDRDKLILSKGHSGPALYGVLADKGFFPKDWLWTMNQGGTRLPSHCDKNLTPGIDMTTGSLGQGLSAGVGMAIANKLDGIGATVYVVLGDGECNEGQVWEAAMAAAQYKLDNLIAFVDYNKMGLDGYLEDVMDIADITSKWSAFNWMVQRVDGHDFDQLDRAILKAKAERGRPSVIVLDTLKGKGCSFAEGRVECHHMAVDDKKVAEAVACLDALKI